MHKLFPIILLLISGKLSAQEATVVEPDYIKSIQLMSSGDYAFVPIISKGGRITLTFDDLEADEKDYYYLIEHCNRNWQTSDLFATDYIRGYDKQQIYNYNNSFNTLQNYTHYKLTLPNKDTKFLISGNYKLSVLDDYDDVVFSRYFIIYEPMTTVGVSVHRTRDVSYIDTQQSVQFVINHKGLMIQNPQEEIYPVVYQNFDFSTSVEGLKPQFIRQDQLLYKYDAETSFWGGNEFLNFDTKEMLVTNNTIARVQTGKDLYESILYQDYPRALDSYTYFPDANGAYVVRNLRSDNSSVEADYSWVKFSLKSEELLDKHIYVYGGFNNFQLNTQNLMTYNTSTQSYEAKILLKQGFYNYTYVAVDDNAVIDAQYFNGSFDETENDYQVIVYYSKFGSRYDRVIGYGVGSSRYLAQ